MEAGANHTNKKIEFSKRFSLYPIILIEHNNQIKNINLLIIYKYIWGALVSTYSIKVEIIRFVTNKSILINLFAYFNGIKALLLSSYYSLTLKLTLMYNTYKVMCIIQVLVKSKRPITPVILVIRHV